MHTTSEQTVTECEEHQLNMGFYGKPMSMREPAENRRRPQAKADERGKPTTKLKRKTQ
jgi:hypothetical protein